MNNIIYVKVLILRSTKSLIITSLVTGMGWKYMAIIFTVCRWTRFLKAWFWQPKKVVPHFAVKPTDSDGVGRKENNILILLNTEL